MISMAVPPEEAARFRRGAAEYEIDSSVANAARWISFRSSLTDATMISLAAPSVGVAGRVQFPIRDAGRSCGLPSPESPLRRIPEFAGDLCR